MKCLLAIVLMASAGAAGAGEPLGRLFLTPEQRTQLDRMRSSRPAPAAAEPEKPAAEPQAPAAVTYSGLVRNSGGRATVWVNNRPLPDALQAGEGGARTRVHEDGSATVTLPQLGSVRLKVGQTADLGSGRIEEGYARRPAAAPAAEAAEPVRDSPPRPRRRVSEERRRSPDEGAP